MPPRSFYNQIVDEIDKLYEDLEARFKEIGRKDSADINHLASVKKECTQTFNRSRDKSRTEKGAEKSMEESLQRIEELQEQAQRCLIESEDGLDDAVAAMNDSISKIDKILEKYRAELEREGEWPSEPPEEKFCFCREGFHGLMIECGNKDCEIEWFHDTCVGLNKKPDPDEEWVCSVCTEAMKKNKQN